MFAKTRKDRKHKCWVRITTYHASNSPVTFVTHKRFAPTVLLRKLTNNSTRTGTPASYKNWDLTISQRNGDTSEKVTEKNLLSVLSNYFMIIPVRSFKSLEFMLELKRVDNFIVVIPCRSLCQLLLNFSGVESWSTVSKLGTRIFQKIEMLIVFF